jgi:DNA modification methylase
MKTLKDYEYFRTENGVLYCGDNMEILPLITEPIDLCLTDPPYGINADKGSSGFGAVMGKKYSDNWDSKIPDKKIFDLILLLKKCIIFGGNYFTEFLKPTKSWIIWDKIGEYNFKNPFSDCEMAWTNYTFATKKYTVIQQGFVAKEKERFHPTQKPVELFIKILNDNTEENNLILDPFLGSGTTALACEKLNRKWIGIEISEKYCEIAKKRIEQYTNQLKLFK